MVLGHARVRFERLANRLVGLLDLAVDRDKTLYTNPSGTFVLEQGDALFLVAELRPERLDELVD